MKFVSFMFIVFLSFSCRDEKNADPSKVSTSKRAFKLVDDENKTKKEMTGCFVKSVSITIKGLILNELIQSGKEAPLKYANTKCGSNLYLSLGGNLLIPLEKELFSESELALKNNTVVFNDLSLTVDQIENIKLIKEGLCIKNYETLAPCKDVSREDCLFYDSYEEEIYEIYFLQIVVNDVEIYKSDLELIFNRDYELTWSDADLTSAFWTQLQTNENCF